MKFITFIVCIFSSTMSNAQDSLLYVKKTSNNEKIEIYLNNIQNGVFTEKDKLIGDVKISPDNKWIAVLLETDDAHYYYSIDNNLKILSTNGEVKYDLKENVRRFLWSNDSRYLAIITGSFYEGGVEYSFENLFIYDLHKKQKQIISGPFKKVNIWAFAWSPDDSSLLIRTISDSRVYEYNRQNKSLILTELKDINLSPDGKYYYQEINSEFNLKFAVFDSKTNSKINLDPLISSLGNSNNNKYGRLAGWAPDEKHNLLFKEIIEDVEYKDDVLYKNNDKIVFRNYTKREMKEIRYKFYDVEKNAQVNEIKSTGAEHKLITNNKTIIYQEKGSNNFKEYRPK